MGPAHLPPKLAARVVSVLKQIAHNNFITEKEFLTGMTIFMKGTPKERVKFLFNVYDLDGSNSITREELEVFLRVLKGSLGSSRPSVLLEEAFEGAEVTYYGVERLTLKQFSKWAQDRMTPGLITWVFQLAPIIPASTLPSQNESSSQEPLPAPAATAQWRGRGTSQATRKGVTEEGGGRPSIWLNRRERCALLLLCFNHI
jgi:hypothetical protein